MQSVEMRTNDHRNLLPAHSVSFVVIITLRYSAKAQDEGHAGNSVSHTTKNMKTRFASLPLS